MLPSLSLQSQKGKEEREQQLHQEEELAQEMARLRTKEMQDGKLRQQIRETSLEIRELEAKLKAGYMNKERAAQLAEKEARKNEEMVSRFIDCVSLCCLSVLLNFMKHQCLYTNLCISSTKLMCLSVAEWLRF